MENPQHHLVQLLHLILFSFHFLLPFLLLLSFPPVRIAAPIRIATVLSPSPFPFPSEVVEDGLGLAAVDHLLQTFVGQLVAFEVDVLQLGAVAQFGGDLAQFVVGEIQHL